MLKICLPYQLKLIVILKLIIICFVKSQTDCPENQVNYNNNCVSSCPEDAPYLFNKICYKNCPGLLGNLINSSGNKVCESCINYKDVQTNTCVETCDIGKGDNNDNKLCNYCVGETIAYNNQCILDKCPIGYKKDNIINIKTTKEIPEEYKESLYCRKCYLEKKLLPETNEEVEICSFDKCTLDGNISNPIAITCDKCPYLSYENNNTECVEECPESLFKFISKDGYGYCKKCPEDKPLKQNNECVESCSIKGLILNDKTKICTKCIDFDENKQYVYYKEYNLDDLSSELTEEANTEILSECVAKCPEGHVTINSPYKYCIRCPENYYLEENTCVKNCTIDRYYKDINYACSYCPDSKYYIYETNSCVDMCPLGTYISSNSEKLTCVKCPSNLYLEDEKCVEICNHPWNISDNELNICSNCKNMSQYAYNNKCVDECNENSIKLLSPYKHCKDCKYPYIYAYENKCLQKCPSETIPNLNNLCIDCSNKFYHKESNTCYDKCPTDMKSYESSIQNYCEKCPKLYLPEENKCIESCPELYENINGACVLRNVPSRKYYYNDKQVDTCPTNYYGSYNYICIKCIEPNCNEKCLDINYVFLKNNKVCRNCIITDISNNEEIVDQNSSQQSDITLNNSSNEQETTETEQVISNSTSDNNESTSSNRILSYNKRFTQQKQVCYYECPIGYYNIKNNNTNNVSSINNIICEKCSKYYDNKSCYNECPKGSSPNSNGYCESCKEKGLYYQENKCVSICSNNYVKNISENTCERCSDLYCFNLGTCYVSNSQRNVLCNCKVGFFGKRCFYKNEEKEELLATLEKDIDYLLNKKDDNNQSKTIYYENIQSVLDRAINLDEITKSDLLINIDKLIQIQGMLIINKEVIANNSIFNSIDFVLGKIKLINNNKDKNVSIGLDFSSNNSNIQKISSSIIALCGSYSECFKLYNSGFIADSQNISIQFSNSFLKNSKNIKSTSNNNLNDKDIVYYNRLLQENNNESKDTPKTTENKDTNKNLPEESNNINLSYMINNYSDSPLVDYSSCNLDNYLLIISKNNNLYNAFNKPVENYYSEAVSSYVINDNKNKSALTLPSDCKEKDIYLPLDLSTDNNINNNNYIDYYLNIKKNYNQDIFDNNSLFYRDFCLQYTFNNATDSTYMSRRRQLNITAVCYDSQEPNKSCQYVGLYELKYVICRCNVNAKDIQYRFQETYYGYNISSKDQNKENYNSERVIDYYSNTRIVDCYKFALDPENIKYNKGFWLIFMQTIITLFIILLFFLFRSKKYVLDNIYEIIYSETKDSVDPNSFIEIYDDSNQYNIYNNLENADNNLKYDNFSPSKPDEKISPLKNNDKGNIIKTDNEKNDNYYNDPFASGMAKPNKDLLENNKYNKNQSFFKEYINNFKYNNSIFNVAYNYTLMYPLWIRILILSFTCTFDLLIICCFYTDRIIDRRAKYADLNGIENLGIDYSFQYELHFAVFTSLLTVGFFFVFGYLLRVYPGQKTKIFKALSTKNEKAICNS